MQHYMLQHIFVETIKNEKNYSIGDNRSQHNHGWPS